MLLNIMVTTSKDGNKGDAMKKLISMGIGILAVIVLVYLVLFIK